MANNSNDIQRSALPIPDLAYTGTVTYDATSPDTHYPPITPAAARRRARRTCSWSCIDDVGFGASSAFGGPIADPELRAGRRSTG